MFGVEFLKNGSEVEESPRWRKLYDDYRMIPHMTLWKFCHKLWVGVLTFFCGFRNLHVVLCVEVYTIIVLVSFRFMNLVSDQSNMGKKSWIQRS